MSTEPGGHTLEALIDELARVLHDADEARELARRAGFPVADLPAFDKASVFWSSIVRAADSGRMLGGVAAIVEQAKTTLPGNRFFAAYGSTTSATVTTTTLPEPGLGPTIDNRSANITQQIVIHGNATFGAMTVSVPPSAGPSLGSGDHEATPPNADSAPRPRADDLGERPPFFEGRAAPSTTRLTPAELDEYRRIALARHERLALDGFASRMRLRPLLRQVHVPLRATDQQLDEGQRVASREQLDPADDAERWSSHEPRPLDEMFALADRYGKRAVVLLGDPGSGKTTQLEWMLLELFDGNAEALSLPEGTLPVFLALRELDPRESMAAFVQRMIVGETSDLGEGFAARLLKHDDVVFMLDGLDEVADPERRVAVARWIDAKHARDHRPGHRFVVTCRHASYVEESKLGAAFLELHLAPLGPEQVRALVERWYAMHCIEHGRRTQTEAGEPSWAETLLEQLSKNKSRHVAAMKGNPLLLTAICMVRAKHPSGMLPDDAESLFEQCTNVLLETWPQRAKRKKLPLRADQARAVLEPVAWCMQKARLDEATTNQLHAAVEDGLRRVQVEELGAGALLESMRDASGLLVGAAPGHYRFVHRGFREYLAALELRARPDELEAVARSFGDPWWREVIPVMLASRDQALLDRFTQLLVRQDGFLEWANGELMDELLAQVRGMARPLVDLVKVIKRRSGHAGDREGLEALVRRGPAAWMDAWRRLETGARVDVRTKVVHGVELVLVPGGRFLMGSPKESQHEVELSSFWLARTPVTNAQYREYLQANPEVEEPEYWGSNSLNQDEQPVVGVSWNEARAYCAWAGLRLPTEAQWEYACRAGTTTRYYSGDTEEDLKKVGWYKANSSGRLHAVGELEPNAWGLYDTHGNVWEWCEDAFGDFATLPRGGDGLRYEPVGEADRVIRGGFFMDEARSARSAHRYGYAPSRRWSFVGLRPAQVHS